MSLSHNFQALLNNFKSSIFVSVLHYDTLCQILFHLQKNDLVNIHVRRFVSNDEWGVQSEVVVHEKPEWRILLTYGGRKGKTYNRKSKMFCRKGMINTYLIRGIWWRLGQEPEHER